MERLERHARRLRRDAERIGLPPPDARAVEAACLETAARAFPRSDGIVRVAWSAAPGERPALEVGARALGAERRRWRAIVAAEVHPGPGERHNAKVVGVHAIEASRRRLAEAEADEALLLDADGRLVEGSRSNLILVDREGSLLTPALSLGPVEGLGLEIVRGSLPTLREAEIRREALGEARELLAVNVVRGVVPIVRVDDAAIGSGEPGPWSARLRPIFSRF